MDPSEGSLTAPAAHFSLRFLSTQDKNDGMHHAGSCLAPPRCSLQSWGFPGAGAACGAQGLGGLSSRLGEDFLSPTIAEVVWVGD